MSVMSEMSLIERCKEFGEEVFSIEDHKLRTKLYMNKLFSHDELEIINKYVALRSWYLNDKQEFSFEYDIGLQKKYSLRPFNSGVRGECKLEDELSDIVSCDIHVWLNGVWICKIPVEDSDDWHDIFFDIHHELKEGFHLNELCGRYIDWKLLNFKLRQHYYKVKSQLGIEV